MATDYTKDIARQLEKLVAESHETNRMLKRIASEMELKQFEDLDPPPKGTVVQNFRGATVMNTSDFEEMENDGRNERTN